MTKIKICLSLSLIIIIGYIVFGLVMFFTGLNGLNNNNVEADNVVQAFGIAFATGLGAAVVIALSIIIFIFSVIYLAMTILLFIDYHYIKNNKFNRIIFILAIIFTIVSVALAVVLLLMKLIIFAILSLLYSVVLILFMTFKRRIFKSNIICQDSK